MTRPMLDPSKQAARAKQRERPVAIVRRGTVRVRRGNADPDALVAWSVAQHVRAARERAGMSQGDLAERSGLARPNVARLESGRHLPSLATLRRVAESLGVTLAALVVVPAESPSAEDKDLAEAGLESWARALDEEDRRT